MDFHRPDVSDPIYTLNNPSVYWTSPNENDRNNRWAFCVHGPLKVKFKNGGNLELEADDGKSNLNPVLFNNKPIDYIDPPEKPMKDAYGNNCLNLVRCVSIIIKTVLASL